MEMTWEDLYGTVFDTALFHSVDLSHGEEEGEESKLTSFPIDAFEPKCATDTSKYSAPTLLTIDKVSELCQSCGYTLCDFQLSATQLEGIRFMLNAEKRLKGGILAHEMGLGKTLDVLTLERITAREAPGTTLILCPLNVSDVWVNECKKFFGGGSISILQYKGPNKEWKSIRGEKVVERSTSDPSTDFIAKHDLVIAHFDSLTSTWSKRVQKSVLEFLENGVKKRKRKGDDGALELFRKVRKIDGNQSTMFSALIKRDSEGESTGYFDNEEKYVCERNELSEKIAQFDWPEKMQIGLKMPELKINDRSAELIGSLLAFRYKRIVVDEAHFMRNPNTLLATMVNAMRSEYRWAVTGTPFVNYTKDVWVQLRFVRARNLPSLNDFETCTRNGSQYLERTLVEYMHKVTKKELVTTTTTTTTTHDEIIEESEEYRMVLPPMVDLPAVYERYIKVDSTETFKKVYDRFHENRKRDFYDMGYGRKRSTHIFATLQYLRQLCSSPLSIKRGVLRETCGEELFDLITEEIPLKFKVERQYLCDRVKSDEKCVIWVHYKETCSSLARYLNNVAKIPTATVTGDNTLEQKTAICDRFQNDSPSKLKVLIATHSISHGVTLTRANHSIHHTPWWHDVDKKQKDGRLHRKGQTRDVYTLYLEIRDTIDEKIREVAKRKTLEKNFTTKSLMQLLGYE